MSPGHGCGLRGSPHLLMGGGGVSTGTVRGTESTPPQPLPIEGRGYVAEAVS